MTIQEMREKRALLVGKAKEITDLAKAESRDLTAEESIAVDGALDEADSMAEQICGAEAAERRQARIADSSADLQRVQKPKASPEMPRIEMGASPGERDRAQHGFKTFGEFASAVYRANPNVARGHRVDERLQIGATMTQGSGPDGGYLVPPSFGTTIWDGLNQAADSLLARTDNYTVEGDSLTFPANAETSRATGSRWGGVQAYWVNEAEQITGSQPKFRQMKLEPQQLAVLVPVTDKLLKNSTVALEQYIGRAATEEINFLVGDAIVNGTGVGKPKGIMASGALVSVAKESGQSAATIVYANIVKMWARCHARSRSNAIWLINQDVEPQLYTLGLTVGTGGLPAFLPPGGLSGAPYATLLGRPIVPCEYCATLGTTGDIVLADLRAYASGTRGSVEAAMSIHLYFDYAKTAFRFMFDVDGQPWMASPITPFKGSNTLSPFVALATRA